jgi:pimeloyl-ACP methyl ester carboxylesterase
MIAPLMRAVRTFRPTSRPAARPFTDQELAAVRVPALVLVGSRSALLRPRRVLERVTACIPGVRAEIVPGAGHGLNLERPELVNGRLLEFVASCRQDVPR